MTARGRFVLALGFGVYVTAWAFGSKPLYPVATGFLLAVVVSWVWVRLAHRPFHVRRSWGEIDHLEGEDVPIVVHADATGTVLPASVTLREHVGRLGPQRHVLERRGRRFGVRYVLRRLRRGRYAFENVRLELADPFGLHRVVLALPSPGSLLVYPRLVRIDRLFSESGAHTADGRRLQLRRPAGFEFHSVREHQQGESLRHVHWRSTARRRQLMVKEFEDTPRDEVAVVLDADARSVVGDSFEVQVRAAGSIVASFIERGRRAVLVVNSAQREVQHVHSPAADWRRALELLAAVEPRGYVPLARLLGEDESPASRALELVVVTARLEHALVDRLLQRAASRRRVSLVYVDPASFNGVAPQPQPLLLRLQTGGVATTVVHAGDDLAAALSAEPVAEVARA